MKNIFDVLHTKEQEILKVKNELDALRIAARLLAEEDDKTGNGKAFSRILAMPDSDDLLDLSIPKEPTA
jgi:hypothetical protein